MLALSQSSRGFSPPVDIFFKSSELAKTMNEGAKLAKEYGAKNGKELRLRLEVLAAAVSLADVPRVPPERCHRLVSPKYRDCFAVDGQHPFRMIFEPAHEPLPRKRDGGLDLAKITAITILEVVDYH
jgi:proteic killer suppression protein